MTLRSAGSSESRSDRQRRQGAAEIVGHRQHVLGEALDAELAFALDVLLGAAAHVLRLGGGAQMLVLQLGVLGLQAFDDALKHFDGRFGAFDRHLSRGAARGWIAGHSVVPGYGCLFWAAFT